MTMKNKFFLHLASFVLAICIILTTLVVAIESESSNLKFYHDFQVENKITEVTGKTQDQLDIISKDLANYLFSGQASLLEKHFNDREIKHMVDVYGLFDLASKVMTATLTIGALILLASMFFKAFRPLLKLTAIYIIGLLVLTGLFALLVSSDFNKYFIKFHELFFDNDLWLLDPRTDLMIQMLPENFFSTMAFNIAKTFAMILIGILGIIGLNELMYKKGLKKCDTCNITEAE